MFIMNDLKEVANTLSLSASYKLQTEIILFCILYAKDNPNASIAECLQAGIEAWIK